MIYSLWGGGIDIDRIVLRYEYGKDINVGWKREKGEKRKKEEKKVGRVS